MKHIFLSLTIILFFCGCGYKDNPKYNDKKNVQKVESN